MSNNQMVSVPREPTEEMIVAFAEVWYSKRQTIDDPDMLDAYAAMLAVAPAEQPQGEPVARYSMDQTGCEELDPDGHWVRYDDMKHADPAEVERLRERIEHLEEENHSFDLGVRAICRFLEMPVPDDQPMSADALIELLGNGADKQGVAHSLVESQLAEAHAMLTDLGVEPEEVSDVYREILKNAERYNLLRERLSVDDFPAPHPTWSTPTESESSRIDELCDAALSASAEPADPVKIERNFFLAGTECLLGITAKVGAEPSNQTKAQTPELIHAGYAGKAGLYQTRAEATCNGEQLIHPVYRIKERP